jgi:uncharacterized protein (DUF2236 family)
MTGTRLRRASAGVHAVRTRVAQAATGPFTHAPYPLAGTLEHMGDPGLLGPDSVSWPVMGDIAAIVGGLRGLLIQAAHPEVVAGVGDHSRYREDPMGRLSRTSAYVTATTYGAMPEVEQAVARVRRVHGPIAGISVRGIPYDASAPGLSAWVHNALTDSFLVANQVYGANPLSPADAIRFVREQTEVGRLLGADPMPETPEALARWIADHPDIGPSPEMADAIAFLTDPPLDRGLKLGYGLILEAAVATIPARVREVLGLRRRVGAVKVGASTVKALRWAMGWSPSWKVALIRTGRPVPEGLFLQDPPVTAR